MAETNDFRVMTSGAFTAAHLELIPKVEALTGKKVVTVTTSMGTGETSIENRLKRGEIADIIIVAEGAMQKFIDAGYVFEEGRTPLAKSTIGIAVRAGAPKPDISSAEALKKTLLDAKSIAYSASVSGQYLLNDLYPKLGIKDACMPKSQFVGGGQRTGAVVARGDAELAFQQMSELLPVPGIDHITPLPPELQKVTTFQAALVKTTRDAELSKRVIKLLSSSEAAAAVKNTGLEAA